MSRASAVWEGDREECAGGKEGDSVGCKQQGWGWRRWRSGDGNGPVRKGSHTFMKTSKK